MGANDIRSEAKDTRSPAHQPSRRRYDPELGITWGACGRLLTVLAYVCLAVPPCLVVLLEHFTRVLAALEASRWGYLIGHAVFTWVSLTFSLALVGGAVCVVGIVKDSGRGAAWRAIVPAWFLACLIAWVLYRAGYLSMPFQYGWAGPEP